MSSATALTRRLEPQNRIGGKYRLRRRIAVGGMGEVWVAKNEATGADVALKVLRKTDAHESAAIDAEARFRHEARLSAMLSHRGIVRIFDLLEEPDGTLVLVMELLRGETLQVYLERKGPRPAKEAVAIISMVLSALQHAHDAGIVHRDITPANIFLAVDPDGQVTPKLVDFGIAKTPSKKQSPQTLDGRVLGTPRYMSPEQIRSGVDIDPRSDLFSVGVVLYEILTGVSPFAASSPAASLASVLETTIDPDARIEPRLWLEIQRAISKRPYERHGTAQELALSLRDALGETEASLSTELTRPPPRPDENESQPGGSMYPPHQTKSIEGQSVALVLPRARWAWAAWAGAALVVAVAVFLTVTFVRRPGTSAAGASPPPATTTAAATTPPPVRTAEAPAAPATSAAATATSPVTAQPTQQTHHVAPKPKPKPRPIATTPGF